MDGIERVYSKDQAFYQCRNWLQANLPNAELIPTSSTAEAARIEAQLAIAKQSDRVEIVALANAISLYLQTGLSLIDDNVTDSLLGAGGREWFFADTDGLDGDDDRLDDLETGEMVSVL